MACSGDGEPAISGLIGGNLLRNIPNLVYFEGGEVRRTSTELVNYIDLNLEEQVNGFDWRKYFAYTQRFFGDNRASAYFTDGCPRRMKENKGCSFCARRRTGTMRSVRAEQAYNHLRLLQNLGAEQVDINDDTFFGNPKFLRELTEQFERRGFLDIELNVYGGVSELTQDKLSLAQRMGVKSILVGIESGNPLVRKINGKPISDKQILEAAKLCKDRGILYNPALIVGMVGETSGTLKDTIELARRLSEESLSSRVYGSLFMPYVGCWAYDLIKHRLKKILFLG
jgi:radical SAM superfamily enzyme YgiQ (UPF0313 family)